MGGGGNSGNFFNPKNLIPAVLTGGISYGLSSLGRAMKPNVPTFTPPPTATATPIPMIQQDQTQAADSAQQKAKRLATMRYGFASTITGGGNQAAANLLAPMATPLKAKLGQ